ncbi:patatin-like phospholipase family protein [Candidatus Berkiella aquae]|uniref:Patatin-like phospholipase family protein n=1 Tax=Candidatus Berkiella aquae TaxID=295108 RepID=A0A0Q9YJN1_9GAMM|nr:patatin-like phospholipase family protein [Candidatus Berkiella aquae]MCS5711340.1 patatin-like phospholipase family protein [Candidatus Berkiella aquae]
MTLSHNTVPSIDIAQLDRVWGQAKHRTTLSREERPPIENLVLEGGGVRGFAYLGALEVLAENGILQNVKRIAGSSAGAIVGLLLALGCEPAEIAKIMEKDLELSKLLDPKYAVDPTRFIPIGGMKIGLSDIANLFRNKGLFKGDAFLEVAKKITGQILARKLKEAIKSRDSTILSEMKSQGKEQAHINQYVEEQYQELLEQYYLDEPGNITFEQLEKIRTDFPTLGFREFFVTGTRLSNGTLKVFNASSDPNMSIVDAVRITMSFPFAFEPVLYQGEYYADGGIASNYPMDIFNQDQFLTHGRNDAGVNPCTLGLLVDSAEEIDSRWGVKKSKKAKLKMGVFVKNVIEGLHNRADDLKNAYSINSIQIYDHDLQTLDFKLTKEKINKLILSGRNALQQYIDHYMSDDVIYNQLPSYDGVYEKYYGKRPEELIRIIEKDLWPTIQETNNFIDLLKKIDFQNELSALDEAMQEYAQNEREEQYSLYFQLEEMADELDNFNQETQVVEKKLRAYQIKKRNLIASLDEAARAKDKKNVASYQKTLNEIIKKISLAEEHKQSIEHERVVIKENYAQMKKLINRELFLLIDQKQILQHVFDNHILAKLRTTESALQEHLDIALDALSSHRKDYPDPRVNEKVETHLFEIKEEYFAAMLKFYLEQEHLDEEQAIQKANERSEIFADLVQFGIKIPKARELIIHYFDAQLLIKRNAKHPLLDMHADMQRQQFRRNFFKRLVYEELEQLNLLNHLNEQDLNEVDELWNRTVNEYLAKDSDISESYAEYLAKEKILKRCKEKVLRKQQQEYKNYKREIKSQVDIEYALKLQAMTKKLGHGKWGNVFLAETRNDVKRNLTNTDVNGTIYGSKFSEFNVATINTKSGPRIRHKAIKKFSNLPGIEAHILTPAKESLRNPVKKSKELIILFNEPKSEGFLNNFSRAIKYNALRRKQFNQYKDEILKKIIWSLRQMQEQDLKPDDAKFKITIAGRGLAGQDAQYLLAAIINKLNKKEIPEFKKVKNLELVLTDPARVSDVVALKTANDLHELKVKRPELKVRGYNVVHQRQVANQRGRKKLENYLGQANVLSKVSPDDALVIADFRDTHDSRHQHRLLTNQNPDSALEKELNESKFIYSNLFVRNISVYAKKLKNVGKFICFQFAPKFFNFIKGKIINAPSMLKDLLSPIYRIAKHFKKKEMISPVLPNWQSKIRSNEQQPIQKKESNNLPLTQSLQSKIKCLINESSPSKRLQREPKPPIENIVLEGGGTNAFACLGALKQLENEGLINNLQRLAGSSSGGIVAALYAMGYSADELMDVFANKINLKDFLDEPYPMAGLDTLFKVNNIDVGIGGIFSLFMNKGLFKGDNFKRLIEKLIDNKLQANLKHIIFEQLSAQEKQLLLNVPAFLPTDERNKRIDDYLGLKLNDLKKKYGISQLGRITFLQAQQLAKAYPALNIKEIFITGTKMSDASLRVFSSESEPSMSIADAVRITMSFPGGFIPVKYKDEFYVDGGVASNYPMQIFDQEKYLSHGLNDAAVNPCTLGILVDSKADIEARWGMLPTQTTELRFSTLVFKVLEGMHNRLGILRDKYSINSVQVSDNLGVNGTYKSSRKFNFNLTKREKMQLYQNGQDALKLYAKQYHGTDVQYSHLEHYKNLYEKYGTKTLPELQRILESEVEPLLAEFARVEPLLQAEQLRLQSTLQQAEIILANTSSQEEILQLLDKQETIQYELDLTNKSSLANQQSTQGVEDKIATINRHKNELLQPYRHHSSQVPPDVHERVMAYDKELEDLAANRRSEALQHDRLKSKQTFLVEERRKLEQRLHQYDESIIDSAITKKQCQQELEAIEQAFWGQGEILQEKSILLRRMQAKGGKPPLEEEDYISRASPLLLSAGAPKMIAAPTLQLGKVSAKDIKDIVSYFPSHEWERFSNGNSHHFHRKSHVDEMIKVTYQATEHLQISGIPTTKLGQLANAYEGKPCAVLVESIEQAKDFIKTLHISGFDIKRINRIEVQGTALIDTKNLIAEILKISLKSRLKPQK